jgi:hypothetical protein
MRRQRNIRRNSTMESLENRRLFSAASIVGQLGTDASITVSTVPSNGDLNPYGTAFVPTGFAKGGPLKPGDLLIANFNSGSNLQGTGTTITDVTPTGQTSTFFQGPAGLGLTTALAVLRDGFVVVGSMPTTDGTSATVQPGSLIILDKFGLQVAQFSNAAVLNGPWDMTVNDQGSHVQLFISNVLSGTIERIDLHIKGPDSISVKSVTQIGSGFTHRSDPSALELGPTGLAFDSKNKTLYVASTADNEIFAIPHASTSNADQGTGHLVYSDAAHLRGPLGLALAPNGDLIAANGDAINPSPDSPSEMVEFTTAGNFVGEFSIDSSEDAPFGIAFGKSGKESLFAAVDDNDNSVTIWTLA